MCKYKIYLAKKKRKDKKEEKVKDKKRLSTFSICFFIAKTQKNPPLSS